MRDHLDELAEYADIALVTFTDRQNLAEYRTTLRLPFPVLLDPDRAAYRAFGLGRGSIGRVYGWKAARRYFQIFRARGLSGLRKPTEDTRQLGGDFVIDPEGVLVYGYWGAGPDDRPPVGDLLDAVRGLRS